MDQNLIWIAGLVFFGLVFGAFVARSSQKREAVNGGLSARIMHYIACSLWTATVPTVLVSVIVLRVDYLTFIQVEWLRRLASAILIALVLVALAYVFLLLYAAIEKNALSPHAQQEDVGWTREDAEKSGL